MSKVYEKVLAVAIAGTLALLPTASYALSKDETVYAKLQNNGSLQNVSVVEHLINDDKAQEILDHTNLQNLENLNGFESFVREETKVRWKAEGKDIYYRGTANYELPIQVAVTYKLDGEEKPLEEILGKSGQIEINLKYTNLAKVGDLYVPFVVAVATTLDESKVSQVEVTNGKATSNGRTIAVAAVAAPGLYESLGIEELKNTDRVTIKFQTEKFELKEIYSIVTPKVLDEADLKTFTELDELYSSANTLADSSKQLVAGTNSLSQGLNELRVAVGAAKQKMQNQEATLDAAAITQIKTAASQQAEQTVETQRTAITAGVKQQLAGNIELAQVLKLGIEQACAAKLGATCPESVANAELAKTVQNLENSMVESSMALAKQTASATAAATAEKVATQVASTMQTEVGKVVVSSLDTMLSGINQLTKGAQDLQTGMTKFDREGIQPLANFVNGKVKVTADKVERLTKLANEYDSYAGKANDVTGTTKFILMVEGRKN